MKLKVGDKVKIINFPIKEIVGKLGTIRDVRSPFRDFLYSVWVVGSKGGWVAVREQEIEKVCTKGLQLTFNFMV